MSDTPSQLTVAETVQNLGPELEEDEDEDYDDIFAGE